MKPKIAITMGDFNGIGPEVILKSLSSGIVQKICIPIIIGSIDVFEYYAKRLRLKMHFREIDTIPDKSSESIISVFHLRKFQKSVIKPGIISQEAGGYATEAIEVAVKLCQQNILEGIITAPTSKEALHKAGYRFQGQTEMLAKYFNSNQYMMMLIAGKFRVGLASIHIPLKKVPKQISEENIFSKISLLHKSLKTDFKIRKPKIAVLGLNPHSGEHGYLGNEEIRFIQPAIHSSRQKGIRVDGPFPADGLFGVHAYKNYDAILAMYHDQGLIPLKMIGFNIGVNFTSGLPIVRTSPDHGTAFDIAGKGIANPSSMIEAIKLAVHIINNRKRKLR